jgi:molecular chaperone HscB
VVKRKGAEVVMAEAVGNLEQQPNVVCIHCGAQSADAHFCSECGKIQPVGAGSDYFGFLGLPGRLRLDEAELEKLFYALSRKFHPDYFTSASAEERRASIERSSMLNDAYRTLRDPIARARYLLTLEGYKEAEKRAPTDLLEEVFELNMQIEELRAAKKTGDEEEAVEARTSIGEALGELNNRLQKIDKQLFAQFDAWDSALDNAAIADEKKLVLDRISELLSHRSYIRNLVRDIKEEL